MTDVLRVPSWRYVNNCRRRTVAATLILTAFPLLSFIVFRSSIADGQRRSKSFGTRRSSIVQGSRETARYRFAVPGLAHICRSSVLKYGPCFLLCIAQGVQARRICIYILVLKLRDPSPSETCISILPNSDSYDHAIIALCHNTI